MKHTPNKDRDRQNTVSLGKAIGDELLDRAKNIRLGFSVDPVDILRAAVTGTILIVIVMLQTTLFSRFALFGATPDLTLAFVTALGVSEGRNRGGIWALISVILVESLGGMTGGIHLLPLLYVPCAYFAGYVTEEHLRDTVPARLIYVSIACLGRGIVSAITAMFALNANLLQILVDIVLPEMLSTFILSIPVHLLVWLCFLPFHRPKKDKFKI